MLALTSHAETELSSGDLRRPVLPFPRPGTSSRWTRSGRSSSANSRRSTVGWEGGAMRAARRPGALVEDLTDRELSILRLLTVTANER